MTLPPTVRTPDGNIILKRHAASITGNPDSARTLVFVHGFGTDQTTWDAVAQAFENDWRIVRFDNAGAGRSEPAAFVASRYLNLNGYAADLLAVCAAADVRDAVLVGHSAGAMMGALAVIREPKRFSKLVMIGASPRYLDAPGYHGGLTDSDLNGIYSAMGSDYAAWAEMFSRNAMGNVDRPHLSQHFAATLRAIVPEHAFTVLCSILQTDYREELPRIGVPTLIVQANADAFVPASVAEYVHDRISGSRLAWIRAEGHFPQVSAPEAVIAAIRDFADAP